ncbi:MAG: ABC transporter ATP-binding protein [Candidatus Dormibacteria bacterium]
MAVTDLTLSMTYARVTALLGPNGAGKTTTLECCEGFRTPDSGSIRVLGLDPGRDRKTLRASVGVMLQEGGIYPSVRAGDILAHTSRLYAHPLEQAPLVERLGLGPSLSTPYRRLSGGQQQRLSLALAIIGRPRLVFLDEPTAGLDPHARQATWQLIRDLRDDGVTLVITTHLIDEAEALADTVSIIDSGRVLVTGSPATLRSTGAQGSIFFRAPGGLDLADLRTALPEGATPIESGEGQYRVSGAAGPETLAALTAWCAARGIMPEDLQVERRSLEQVYLDLTRDSGPS